MNQTLFIISILTILTLVYFIVKYVLNELNQSIVNLEKTIIDNYKHLNPTIINNIETTVMITSGGKHYGQIGYECKILLYEDFLVIFRTQKIIFKINLKPYIVSTNIKNKFGETFVPNRIEFKTVQRRHIEIKAIDREYDHRKVTIVLDNLSIENIESLEKLKHWTL